MFTKCIDELKTLKLQTVTGWGTDHIIINTFKIGQILHKYKLTEHLKTPLKLSNFILKYITKEDNKLLFIYGSYYLKEFKWLKSTFKTIYNRPDIKFLYKPLYYPKMTTAKQFKKHIGKIVYKIKPYNTNIINVNNNYFCLFDCMFTPRKEFENQIEARNKLYKTTYLELNKTFINKIYNNDFNIINTHNPIYNSIELIDQKNGYVLGVYNAEIGNKFLFYMPLEEIKKLYQEAVQEYKGI